MWGVLRRVCVGCVEARNIKVGRGTGCVGCVEVGEGNAGEVMRAAC